MGMDEIEVEAVIFDAPLRPPQPVIDQDPAHPEGGDIDTSWIVDLHIIIGIVLAESVFLKVAKGTEHRRNYNDLFEVLFYLSNLMLDKHLSDKRLVFIGVGGGEDQESLILQALLRGALRV